MSRPANEGGAGDPGPTLIAADPHALRAFAAEVRASAQGASDELTTYNQALMALDDQPIDPGYAFPPNRLFEVAAVFQGLESTCYQAKDFAAALEQLDANADGELDAIDGLTPEMLDLFLRARAGNPDFEIDQLDLPALLCELASQNGLDTDPEYVRDQLQDLLDAGQIDYGDLENPLLVSYLIERGISGVLGTVDEFETLKISIEDDGSLNGLGMHDWDPAVLAAIQKALEDDAAVVLGDYLSDDVVMGMVPPAPDGMDPDEFAEKYLARQRQWRRYSAENLLGQIEQQGDRGFYSSDLYDRLLDDYESAQSTRFDEALLLAITQSALHGPIPIYDMTKWDKFKGGVDTLADVAVWVGTGALLLPGGQVAGGIIRVAGGVVLLGTGVDVVDACAVNDDKSNCMQEIALAGVDGITTGKIKAIEKYFLLDGPLTLSEKRILRGLEMEGSVTGSTLDTLTDGDPTYEVESHTIRPGSRN
ncbi:hypothetical protein BH10ACT1_BH10ACT1_07470 [soil metagenome]